LSSATRSSRPSERASDAGLSEAQLSRAVAVARTVRDEGIELLTPRVDQLLGDDPVRYEPIQLAATSRAQELVALGASIGVNSHRLIHRHIAAAYELGLSFAELAAATRMAEYVQKRASEFTSEAVKKGLEDVRRTALAESWPQRSRTKEDEMARMSIDCRNYPDDTGCTLYLSGEEDHVVQAAAEHAVSVHSAEDTPELREWLRSNLKEEEEAALAHV
jgi:Protein of unknown function (DUF1059)